MSTDRIEFLDWITQQTARKDAAGELARFYASSGKKSAKTDDRKELRKQLKEVLGADQEMLQRFDTAYKMYREKS